MNRVDDFIAHYGKKGMRWGVRRRSATLVKTPKKTSADHKKVSELRKKRTSELTNKQLKEHNERINLEQKFNQVNPTKKAKGQAKVKALLGTATAGITIYNMANSPAGRAAITAGKTALKLHPKGKHFKK